MSALNCTLTSLILFLYCLPVNAQTWEVYFKEKPSGEASYTAILINKKSENLTLTTFAIGRSDNNCSPSEILLKIESTSDGINLGPATRLKTEYGDVHMFTNLDRITEDRNIVMSYSVHLLPEELKEIAKSTPIISGHSLNGFPDALQEYFKGMSHLVYCE